MSSEEDVKRVLRQADEQLCGGDALINNAASATGSTIEGDYPEWQYVVGVNLLGYVARCREALVRMRPKRGEHILPVSAHRADGREEGKNIYVATEGDCSRPAPELNGERPGLMIQRAPAASPFE